MERETTHWQAKSKNISSLETDKRACEVIGETTASVIKRATK